MKQDIQNIVEGNKLIAEFMGLKIGTAIEVWNKKAEYSKDAQFDYHLYWDDLKPVIDKISEWYDNDSDKFYKEFQIFESEGTTIFDLKITSSIKSAYQFVIQFIQWYNNQQKQVKE